MRSKRGTGFFSIFAYLITEVFSYDQQLIDQGEERGIERGIEQGREQGVMEIVQNMFASKMPLDDIVRFSGLPLDTVKGLVD